MTEIKECKIHGSTKFIKSPTSSCYRCSKCRVEAVQRFRDNAKKKAVEYKGGKCSICGYNKYVGALEFHHLDPEKKDFAISGSGKIRKWEKVKPELDKCALLCSNCHKEVHGGLIDIK